MTQEDIFLYLMPSWHKKGTQLLKETLPDNQSFTKHLKSRVPSRDPKGTQRTEKDTRLQKKISAYYLAIIEH